MHYFTPKRCTESNKIMYHDRATALRAADQSFIERGTELWVYQCEFCGNWHLTHRDPKDTAVFASMRAGSGAGRKQHSRKRGFKPRRR